MHQIAAPVACVLAGLWLAYLVPYQLRHRQQLLESRADDRYSEALRVVAVTRRERGAQATRSGQMVGLVADRAHAGTTGLLTPGRGLTAMAVGRTGGDTVDRPHATGEHVTAEAARRAAQVRAARAAASARRAAAARRRAALAVVLLVASVAGWAARGLVPATPLLVGIAPTVLLALVLVTGRRAVVAGRRNDEAMARQILESEELAANPRSGATRVVAPAVTAASAAVPGAAAAPVTARSAATTQSGARTVVAARSAGTAARAGAARAAAVGAGAAAVGAAGAQSAPTATVKAQSAPTPRVVGRAVHPSDASTEVFAAIVADHGEKGAAARHATGELPAVAVARAAEESGRGDAAAAAATVSSSGAAATPAAPRVSSSAAAATLAAPDVSLSAGASGSDEGWAPVPVPRPTYAMKPAAPRREPVALGEVEGSTAARPASAADTPSGDDVLLTPEPPAEVSASIDLNAVLAKRRAAGQ